MTKVTRLLIATCLLALVAGLLLFGPNKQKEEYRILGIFCGIATCFCAIATLDAKAGKRSNLILMGLFMSVLAGLFIGTRELFPTICLIAAIVFGLCGLLLLVLGVIQTVKAWRNRSPEDKRPINATMYVGMALILLGLIGIPLLYEFFVRLVLVAVLVIVIGIIVLYVGNYKRKNGKKKPVSAQEDFNSDEIEIPDNTASQTESTNDGNVTKTTETE